MDCCLSMSMHNAISLIKDCFVQLYINIMDDKANKHTSRQCAMPSPSLCRREGEGDQTVLCVWRTRQVNSPPFACITHSFFRHYHLEMTMAAAGPVGVLRMVGTSGSMSSNVTKAVSTKVPWLLSTIDIGLYSTTVVRTGRLPCKNKRNARH